MKYMVEIDKFLSKCKTPLPEKVCRPLTEEEQETKVEIIKYILNNKSQVNYTERIFSKLENILNDLLGGK